MKIICPFCLSRTHEVPRCPACHGVLPALQPAGREEISGCTDLVELRQDAAGTWMAGRRSGRNVLVWAGPEKTGESVRETSSGFLEPLESGRMEDGRRYCIWEMPESTLAARARMNIDEGYRLWENLRDAGILSSGFEGYPFEIVVGQGGVKALAGRPFSAIPPAGTIHAPERLTGAPVSEKTRVFTAAAWFLYIISGQYPVGIPTPASWRKKNLDTLDEILFAALRAEPSRRPSMADFEKRLRAAVSGPPLAHWVIDGVFWVLGAGLLAAWASGLVWVVTHFDLL